MSESPPKNGDGARQDADPTIISKKQFEVISTAGHRQAIAAKADAGANDAPGRRMKQSLREADGEDAS